MGNNMSLCVYVCVVSGTGVFGLICVKARERPSRFLLQICHHNSAERRRDHNNVIEHKRQDGQTNE